MVHAKLLNSVLAALALVLAGSKRSLRLEDLGRLESRSREGRGGCQALG